MPPAVVPPSPPLRSGEEAEDASGASGASGRGERDGSSPGGTATLQQPRRSGSPAGRSRPARPASTVRSPAANGGRAPPAPRGREPAARVPAAQRRAAVPDGRSSSSVPGANEGEAPRAAERRAAVPDGAAAASPVAARRYAATLRQLLPRISPNRREVCEASGLVKEVVTILIEAFRNQKKKFVSIEVPEAGVSCWLPRVSEPNKFEVPLEMPVEALVLSRRAGSGVFFDLTFRGRVPKENYLLEFLDEDQKLSACKMLNALRGIIKQKVKTKGFLKQAGEKIPGVAVSVERNPGSPAITLLITNGNRQPPAVISVDLILTLEAEKKVSLPRKLWLDSSVRKSIGKKPLHLVPRGDYWQLSFSHIERLMLKNHGNTKTCCAPSGAKCCRQEYLALLKFFLEELKAEFPAELEVFSWHHIQTAFFHSCVQYPNDSAWRGKLQDCYQRVLRELLCRLRASSLPHFFIRSHNLLSQEHQASNAFLAGKVEAELSRFQM